MDPITGAPDNPLLTQIRQQRAMQQPDVPPPSLLPPPGMDTGAPPIMQTPQPNVVDRHFNQANAAPQSTLLGSSQKRNRQVLALRTRFSSGVWGHHQFQFRAESPAGWKALRWVGSGWVHYRRHRSRSRVLA